MESQTNEHCPNLPLPRYPGESAKAYLAFVTFYCMKDRTYQKVADAVDVSLITIKRWASDNKWSDRLMEQKARILGQRVAAEDAIVKIETAKLEEESKARLNFSERLNYYRDLHQRMLDDYVLQHADKTRLGELTNFLV